jgi:cytochrome c oxidase subunit II
VAGKRTAKGGEQERLKATIDRIDERGGTVRLKILLFAVVTATALAFMPNCVLAENEEVIEISAKKFDFSPKEITLKKGVPVLLRFTSKDRVHGFNCPELNIRTDIRPEQASTIRFIPDKVGTFSCHCDRFCGLGHGSMKGAIKVVE